MSAELTTRMQSAVSAQKLVIGFIAGFLAVLIFHQPVLFLLTVVGFSKAATYSMHATAPFGVPQVLSLSFWGGLWGIVFALVEGRFPRGAAYWIVAFLFGAIFPTLVAWFVAAPLKGQPMAGGWDAYRMMTGLIINGAWGVGTALFFALGIGMTRNGRSS
ncbi:MAG TPA: hypothetical protein VFG44_04895 [Burkholderiales bacterium]|jgi:hypothetical protein|nr:hypothetical protein [Burkholderiales bacterium]